MPEHGGAGDDDEDHAGDPRGLVQRAHEPAPGEVAPDQRDQERPEGADGRRFRGREKAHEVASQLVMAAGIYNYYE